MNEKAYVSKELSAKHTKLLEHLLTLPGNRDCADCQSRAPRWASVNLGIFICMQCSGIHRSLGVHISKVRSTTLDTWLPDQVAFMKSMGNEKSNSYWEAELPPNFDRSRIATFIRAKYEEKRWVPNNRASVSATQPGEKCFKSNRLADCPARSLISRKFSLEEEILTKHMAQVAPTVRRPRGGSLDMKNKFNVSLLPKELPSKTEDSSSSMKKTNRATDLFNLLYNHNAKHNCSMKHMGQGDA